MFSFIMKEILLLGITYLEHVEAAPSENVSNLDRESVLTATIEHLNAYIAVTLANRLGVLTSVHDDYGNQKRGEDEKKYIQ